MGTKLNFASAKVKNKHKVYNLCFALFRKNIFKTTYIT